MGQSRNKSKQVIFCHGKYVLVKKNTFIILLSIQKQIIFTVFIRETKFSWIFVWIKCINYYLFLKELDEATKFWFEFGPKYILVV